MNAAATRGGGAPFVSRGAPSSMARTHVMVVATNEELSIALQAAEAAGLVSADAT